MCRIIKWLLVTSVSGALLAELTAFQSTKFWNVTQAFIHSPPLSFGLSFLSPEVWGNGFTKAIEWIDEALALMMFIPLAYWSFLAVSLVLHVVFNTVGVPVFTRLANSGPDWVLSLAESQYTDIAQQARGQLAGVRIPGPRDPLFVLRWSFLTSPPRLRRREKLLPKSSAQRACCSSTATCKRARHASPPACT